MLSKFKMFVFILVFIISVIFLYYFFSRETFKSKKEIKNQELEDDMESVLNTNVRFINKLLHKSDIAHNLKHV